MLRIERRRAPSYSEGWIRAHSPYCCARCRRPVRGGRAWRCAEGLFCPAPSCGFAESLPADAEPIGVGR